MTKQMITEENINIFFAKRQNYDKTRYISRNNCEVDLRRKIERNRYVFITGESGSGKTWLVDDYISRNGLKRTYINLAEVGTCHGFSNYLMMNSHEEKVEKTTDVKGKVGVGISAVSGRQTDKYIVKHNYLWEFVEANKESVIILDNFESIIENKELIGEIGCLITLADDPRMIKFAPKFLIIGALRDVVKYFQMMSNYQTIANRVGKVSIKGFTDTETHDFVMKGFRGCGFDLKNSAELSKEIFIHTGGFPQAVNELCYNIALVHLDDNKNEIAISGESIIKAERQWLNESLLAEYSVVNEYFMKNLSETEYLNNILYSFTEIQMREFSVSEIIAQAEELINDEKRSISKTKVKAFLDELSEEENNRNILVKTNENGYKLKSYKTLACIRITLKIEGNCVICQGDIEI